MTYRSRRELVGIVLIGFTLAAIANYFLDRWYEAQRCTELYAQATNARDTLFVAMPGNCPAPPLR